MFFTCEPAATRWGACPSEFAADDKLEIEAITGYRKSDPLPARSRPVDAESGKPSAPRRKFVKWVGWAKQQCSWEVADGAELNPEELMGEEITVASHKPGTTQAMINRHISGSTCLVISSDDSIDDFDFD